MSGETTLVVLKCEVCGFTQDVPGHCGKPMRGAMRGFFLKKSVKLVCSNDKCRYEVALFIHCGKPMKLIELPLSI